MSVCAAEKKNHPQLFTFQWSNTEDANWKGETNSQNQYLNNHIANIVIYQFAHSVGKEKQEQVVKHSLKSNKNVCV